MIIFRCFICSIIIVACFHIYAQSLPISNPDTLTKKRLIDQFFNYLNFLGNPESKIDSHSLEAFMTLDCTVQSNQEILSRGIDEFMVYINNMQKKYEKVAYSAFLEEPLIFANQATLHFQVDCIQKNGPQKKLDVMALVTFTREKISHWNEFFCNLKTDKTLDINNIDFNHSYEEPHFYHPLYPITPPLNEGFLPVSDIHSLFYATYGNPNGIPIVVLHGGPGEGSTDVLTRFFDLERYYVIMFDQRGSMRSRPFACMEENTPYHSVSDIEALRKHLNIEKWLVFGGSWGSTLAILYGQSHPERCEGFILRGIFLGREEDYLHLLYGMGQMAPKAYKNFLHHIPLEERSDLLSAYYQRIMNPDPTIHIPAARAFIEFDATCVRFKADPSNLKNILKNEKSVYCVAKHFLYYSMNKFFLSQDQILSAMDRIKYIPAIIIHGKYDIVTLPENAYRLYEKWDKSCLWMVPEGGHTSSEPATASALAVALDCFAQRLYKM